MKQKGTIRKAAAILVNILIPILAFGSWGVMVTGRDTGSILTSARFISLKYFTIDSNLLMGLASLCILPWQIRSLADENVQIPLPAFVLKLTGTTSVSLTFLVVMVFLGPVFGYPGMFKGANLYLHLVVPVLAILIFCLTEGTDRLMLRHTVIAAIPMLIYGLIYLGNILINGVGQWPNTNDWYGFTMWGVPAGFLVYIVIALVTWLIAVLLRLANIKSLQAYRMREARQENLAD